jgi:cytochrome c-type protein NapC
MSTNGQDNNSGRQPGAIRRLWQALWSPTAAYSLGTLLIVGGIAGIVFWGGFNWAMEITNTEKFCISCHEMEQNVYVEYKETIHFSNRSGVRASCPDCHVPKEWIHKVKRKIIASNELFHHFAGTVSTPEKFDAKRLQLATNVWKAMKSTDSRECRNCHDFDSMDFTKQETRSGKAHQEAIDTNKTCIDCHQGIAHTLPQGAEDAYRNLSASFQHPKSAQPTDALASLRMFVSGLTE